MKTRTAVLGTALLLSLAFSLCFSCVSWAADADFDMEKSSSMQMMERAENIVYGEPHKGGIIERLNAIETELFGRGLPGSISERHAAILNFLEIGTADQPSMLFKLGVAEWVVGEASQVKKAALTRVESLEMDLDGVMQYGKPLAMRVERLLASLVADPLTFRNVTLPHATLLKLQFLEELGPATTQKGDSVNLVLTDDLMVEDVLVAPKGSLIDTMVRSVRQPKNFGVPSDIRFDFRSLIPLGPQRIQVITGEVSKKATTEAQKGQDKGEGGIIGAVGVGIGGALLLGPVGLPLAFIVRGNAIKIPAGTVMFLETSDDVTVSGYPVPESLRADPNAAVREAVGAQPAAGASETIVLPPEQNIN